MSTTGSELSCEFSIYSGACLDRFFDPPALITYPVGATAFQPSSTLLFHSRTPRVPSELSISVSPSSAARRIRNPSVAIFGSARYCPVNLTLPSATATEPVNEPTFKIDNSPFPVLTRVPFPASVFTFASAISAEPSTLNTGNSSGCTPASGTGASSASVLPNHFFKR